MFSTSNLRTKGPLLTMTNEAAACLEDGMDLYRRALVGKCREDEELHRQTQAKNIELGNQNTELVDTNTSLAEENRAMRQMIEEMRDPESLARLREAEEKSRKKQAEILKVREEMALMATLE
ncbi:hypothetical protein P7C70_g9437, partial [Phenoliferia sp. Uapishka_3]